MQEFVFFIKLKTTQNFKLIYIKFSNDAIQPPKMSNFSQPNLPQPISRHHQVEFHCD